MSPLPPGLAGRLLALGMLWLGKPWLGEPQLGEPQLGQDLPAGPGEALHILEEGGSGWWTFIGILLVPLLLGFLAQRLRGRRQGQPAAPAERSEVVPPPVPSNSLAQAIDSLRDRTLADADYRAGCHRLGALMRDHVHGRGVPQVSTWTVREILARLGDTPISTVLGLLADLQFRRAEPKQEEFLDICQLARDSASSPSRPAKPAVGGPG